VTDQDNWCLGAESVYESIEIGEMELAVITKGGLVRLPETGQIRR
jgi:hypothetical protein